MEPNLAAATRTDRVITISTGAIGVCLIVYGTKENRNRGPERVQGFDDVSRTLVVPADSGCMCRSATLCSWMTGYSILCDCVESMFHLLVGGAYRCLIDACSAKPGSTLESCRVHLIAHSEEGVNNGLQIHRLPSTMTNNMHRFG